MAANATAGEPPPFPDNGSQYPPPQPPSDDLPGGANGGGPNGPNVLQNNRFTILMNQPPRLTMQMSLRGGAGDRFDSESESSEYNGHFDLNETDSLNSIVSRAFQALLV